MDQIEELSASLALDTDPYYPIDTPLIKYHCFIYGLGMTISKGLCNFVQFFKFQESVMVPHQVSKTE